MEELAAKSKSKQEEQVSPRTFKANRLEFGEAEVKPTVLNDLDVRQRNKQKEVVHKILMNDLQIKGLQNKQEGSTGESNPRNPIKRETRAFKSESLKSRNSVFKSEKSTVPVVWGPDNNIIVSNQTALPSRFVRDPTEVLRGFREDLVMRLIRNSFKQQEKIKNENALEMKLAQHQTQEDSKVHQEHRFSRQYVTDRSQTKQIQVVVKPIGKPEPSKKGSFLATLKEDYKTIRQTMGLRKCGPRSNIGNSSQTNNFSKEKSLFELDETKGKEEPQITTRSLEKHAHYSSLSLSEIPENLTVGYKANSSIFPTIQPSSKSRPTDPIKYLCENERFQRSRAPLEVRRLHPPTSSTNAATEPKTENSLANVKESATSMRPKRPNFVYQNSKRGQFSIILEKETSQVTKESNNTEVLEDRPSSTRGWGLGCGFDLTTLFELDLSKSAPGFSKGPHHRSTTLKQQQSEMFPLPAVAPPTHTKSNASFRKPKKWLGGDCAKSNSQLPVAAEGWVCLQSGRDTAGDRHARRVLEEIDTQDRDHRGAPVVPVLATTRNDTFCDGQSLKSWSS